jgi:hypothetical protein
MKRSTKKRDPVKAAKAALGQLQSVWHRVEKQRALLRANQLIQVRARQRLWGGSLA